MSHGPSLGGEPAHGPAGRRTMQSAARTGYPRYVDLTYTPHFEGLEIVYGSRGRTGSSSSSRNPVRGVMRTWTLTGSSLYRTDPLPGYPGYPLHASPEIRGNYEFEEEIEGQEATRWNVLPCVRLKNGATPAMVPPAAPVPAPVAAPRGKFDLIEPSALELAGIPTFMDVPAMNDELCLVLHAAAQLRVEMMEKSDIVPTKNKYAVMVRDYAIADVSAISLQYYHGNLTTTLTTRAYYKVITFDLASYAEIVDDMIPSSSLHGLEKIARGLRETAKIWRYIVGGDNFLTGYFTNVFEKVQQLAEIITPAIAHVSVTKVEFLLAQDIITLRSALGRHVTKTTVERRAQLISTDASRRATLWQEHVSTREESARLQGEHNPNTITESDIRRLIREYSDASPGGGNKRVKTSKSSDELREERRKHWCRGTAPATLPSLPKPTGTYKIDATARGCSEWKGRYIDTEFLVTGKIGDANKVQAILSNPAAGLIFQGNLFERYRKVRHYLIANDPNLLDKFVTRIKIE